MDKVLKVGQQSLLGYLPAIVIKNVLDGDIDPNKVLPAYHTMKTVSLFADISGFTKLSEVFAKKGRIGPEFLAFSLNRYMEQLRKNGGDIFKFAGDALLVVWPETKNSMEDTCRRAIQCAMDIQSKLNKVEMSPGKPLSVKIGLGCGECKVLFVGGQFKRCEYLIVGEAMKQACESETHATEGGQTIISQSVYDVVKAHYEVEVAVGDGSHGHDESDDKYYMIKKLIGQRVAIKSDAYLMRTQFSQEKLRDKHPILKTFVPAAISIYLDIEKENWSKEIRMLTVMFMNLKVDLSQLNNDDGMKRIQQIVHQVQRCVYKTKGSLNKFLMDDKGSVMLIAWGLPPLSAHDDHVRSVLTAIDLAKELKKLNCGAYMGIATGTCFTGVCGTVGGRREYSLLGEMVNLSARHMQKAIYYAKEIEQETKKKVDFLTLICEKTRDLIQNKISSDYLCQGELKGFTNIFYFYEPKLDLKPKIESSSFFLPDIKTHRNNILIGQPNPKEKLTPDFMLKNALYMVGRKEHLEECFNYLQNVHKNADREFLLIRGKTGSGKSLFLRKLMFDFIEANKELKNKLNNKFPFIFITFQLPTTQYESMNGFNKVMKDMYAHLIQNMKGKRETKFNLGTETITINCDLIGEILLNSDCLSYVRYIEEILDISFDDHYQLPTDSIFSKFFKIKEIPKRDNFFESRKFDRHEKNICRFFKQMIKTYRDSFIPEFPLIFIIEDAHLIDEISIELMRSLTSPLNQTDNKLIKGVCVLTTYQDSINSIVRNQFDRFSKTNDLFLTEKTFIMDNITEFSLVHDLLRHNIQGKVNVSQISEKLINIILSKSMKGNPLFIVDIMNSLIDSGYVKTPHQELQPTDELLEMYEMNDWSNFNIPIRMERLLGNMMDNLNPKEVIILKHASVIGNLFDIDKLDDLNPFNSVTFDDLVNILSNLEYHGIVEIMYDLNPKQIVYKFNFPFFREILFQRSLIEQRLEIHLNIARSMQYNKFSYMPHKQEVALLRNHLKITEKTILKHMEDKDDDVMLANGEDTNAGSSLNINNMKIVLVKDICERLKLIDLRMESEEIELSKRSLPIIKSGYLHKKSDKYISWEERYIVITNTKFFYWYHKEDYMENKMPLGSFELKSLYNVEILRDKFKGDRNNLVHIQVSNWFKKDLIKGARDFYFSSITRDELYVWVITLNFLRVKATYDEFSCNFGLINLPLSHEIKRTNKKRFKQKFHKNSNNKNNITTNTLYPSGARRSVLTGKSDSSNKLDLRRASTNIAIQNDNQNEEAENVEKINKFKDILANSLNYGIVSILGFIQDIIFGIDNVGMSDDYIIMIPSHLKEFKKLATSKTIKNMENEIAENISKNNKLIPLNLKYEIEEKNDYEDSESEKSEDKSNLSNLEKISKETENEKSIELERNSKIRNNLKNENVITVDKNESNISFQVNPNNKNVLTNINNNLNSANKNNTSEKKTFTKQFTLQSQNIIPNNSKVEYENTIHNKLKQIDIDSNDDQVEHLINSISGVHSHLSDESAQTDYIPKRNDNVMNEINGKIRYSNVSSLIFNKNK